MAHPLLLTSSPARQRYPLSKWVRSLCLLSIFLFPLLSCDLPGTAYDSTNPTPSTQPYTPTNYVQPTVEGSYNALNTHYVEQEYVEIDITEVPIVPTATVLVLTTQGSFTGTIYTVEQGDSFVKLAEIFCGDSRQYKHLLAINHTQEGEILSVGEKVLIHCEETK